MVKLRNDILQHMDERIAKAETDEEKQKVIKEKENFLAVGEETKARAEAKLEHLRKKRSIK
ncbi:hypothetical protein [Virgibacillus halodenitrificans]|uniref:hypothetical protein n=1 Tax=Virgibacillus halodenitrificans TaxID=1482 RepID=UPI000EF4CBDC|nr:hypothetical protein [Virgibacillus halodenitrificans]